MKKINTYSMMAITLLFASNLGAQQNVNQPVKTMDINETSEIEVMPNKITIRIELKERTELKNEAKISIRTQEDSLRNFLKRMKIDASKLSVVSMNTNYTQIRKKEKDAVTSMVFDLEVSKFADQNAIFNKLDKWQVYQAFISNVEHSKYDSLMLEVQKAALIKAKVNASYLLSSIGESVLTPIEIRFDKMFENNFYMVGGERAMKFQTLAGVSESADDRDETLERLELKKIKIKSNVFVKFQLK